MLLSHTSAVQIGAVGFYLPPISPRKKSSRRDRASSDAGSLLATRTVTPRDSSDGAVRRLELRLCLRHLMGRKVELCLFGQDYAVRGVMELDLTYSGASIGKRGERNACASIAIAVDAESGMVLAPEVTDSSVPAGDTLAKVFFKAIQPSRTMPKEVRVRKQKFKDSLAPLMESLGVTVRVASRLPASDEARSHLLDFSRGDIGGR